MKCLFTIHAGEFLVGDHLERNFKGVNLWAPSKDTGTDLLVTNAKNARSVSLQVKFSRDYLQTNLSSEFQSTLRAWGWWTLNRGQITRSKADYWVFVLKGFEQKHIDFVIIRPLDLIKRLDEIHGVMARTHVYLWVTKKDRCWETRDLKPDQKSRIAKGSHSDKIRDFSKYLNKWGTIEALSRK